MNLKTLIETLKAKLNSDLDYNLSKKNGKYIISTEEEMSASKAPKWAIELIADVRSIKKDIVEIKGRLDVIEDKLERNDIK